MTGFQKHHVVGNTGDFQLLLRTMDIIKNSTWKDFIYSRAACRAPSLKVRTILEVISQ